MRGHISTEFTVWCGLCDEWLQESAPTKTVATKLFKARGWKNTKANGWVCNGHMGAQKTQETVREGLCSKCKKVPAMIGQNLCYVCAPYGFKSN